MNTETLPPHAPMSVSDTAQSLLAAPAPAFLYHRESAVRGVLWGIPAGLISIFSSVWLAGSVYMGLPGLTEAVLISWGSALVAVSALGRFAVHLFKFSSIKNSLLASALTVAPLLAIEIVPQIGGATMVGPIFILVLICSFLISINLWLPHKAHSHSIALKDNE